MAPEPASDDGRSETREERLDRHWNELLQELRVTQTGVQLLAGFLLTMPFQQRFAQLQEHQRRLYRGPVLLACLPTILLGAPVAVHRAVFQRHQRAELVHTADRLARFGLGALGLAVTGVVPLVFSVVLGRGAGLAAGGVLLVAVLVFWVLVPWRLRRGTTARGT